MTERGIVKVWKKMPRWKATIESESDNGFNKVRDYGRLEQVHQLSARQTDRSPITSVGVHNRTIALVFTNITFGVEPYGRAEVEVMIAKILVDPSGEDESSGGVLRCNATLFEGPQAGYFTVVVASGEPLQGSAADYLWYDCVNIL